MNLLINEAIRRKLNAQLHSTTDPAGVTTYRIRKGEHTVAVNVSAAYHAANSAEHIASNVAAEAGKLFAKSRDSASKKGDKDAQSLGKIDPADPAKLAGERGCEGCIR